MSVKWVTTGVQENPNLSVLASPVCVTRYNLGKIDAARACTREEANQCVWHPGESVRDTLQKSACPPLDPRVQLGSMIYSGCNHKSLQRSSHGSGKTLRVMSQTRAGGITEEWGTPIRLQLWNPESHWCRSDCGTKGLPAWRSLRKW